jgi:hypothetical protein
VPILLVFAWIGTLGMFVQVAHGGLSAPVIPLLTGYAVAALAELRHPAVGVKHRPVSLALGRRHNLRGAGAVAPCRRIISAAHASGEVTISLPEHRPTSPAAARTSSRSLDNLPRGRILAPHSLGPPILYATDHTVVSAPYHRSAAALGNGLLAFGETRMTFSLPWTGRARITSSCVPRGVTAMAAPSSTGSCVAIRSRLCTRAGHVDPERSSC